MATTPSSVWRNPWHFLAFGLGSGAAPFAPGTFGTLAAVPLYLLLASFLPALQLGVFILLSFVFGCWLTGKVAKDIGVHDHGGIVWDEFVGLWLTAYFLPLSWGWLLAAFLAFRFFDIIKPWPIKLLDTKVSGGLGIMLDDVLAAVFALLSVKLGYLIFTTFI